MPIEMIRMNRELLQKDLGMLIGAMGYTLEFLNKNWKWLE